MAKLTNQMLVYKHCRVIPRIVIPRIEGVAKTMLVYKHCRVIPRIVIPRIEGVAKTPKLNRKIKLGISSDFGITNLRFILRF